MIQITFGTDLEGHFFWIMHCKLSWQGTKKQFLTETIDTQTFAKQGASVQL